METKTSSAEEDTQGDVAYWEEINTLTTFITDNVDQMASSKSVNVSILKDIMGQSEEIVSLIKSMPGYKPLEDDPYRPSVKNRVYAPIRRRRRRKKTATGTPGSTSEVSAPASSSTSNSEGNKPTSGSNNEDTVTSTTNDDRRSSGLFSLLEAADLKDDSLKGSPNGSRDGKRSKSDSS